MPPGDRWVLLVIGIRYHNLVVLPRNTGSGGGCSAISEAVTEYSAFLEGRPVLAKVSVSRVIDSERCPRDLQAFVESEGKQRNWVLAPLRLYFYIPSGTTIDLARPLQLRMGMNKAKDFLYFYEDKLQVECSGDSRSCTLDLQGVDNYRLEFGDKMHVRADRGAKSYLQFAIRAGTEFNPLLLSRGPCQENCVIPIRSGPMWGQLKLAPGGTTSINSGENTDVQSNLGLGLQIKDRQEQVYMPLFDTSFHRGRELAWPGVEYKYFFADNPEYKSIDGFVAGNRDYMEVHRNSETGDMYFVMKTNYFEF